MKTTIRFAPIIRVSTEQQEKQGESLLTQKAQITQYVKSLNGVIPDTLWQYSGQEHATPGQERTRLDRLLNDSSKGLFDAVIVCDASRWSRDNLKSKEGLNILRSNNIRFFAGTTEYDLYNPAQNLFLGMSAEIGEYQAREQALKSITNRINRARRGIPTSGKLPYGRTWNEKTGWSVDPAKQQIIQQAAERYLSGENIQDIAATYDMNFTNLWKILNHRSGTEWSCQFKNEEVNVNETVVMEIPALLDQQTIEAIHQRAEASRTYHRGEIKHRYLLSRMIFCSKCGYAVFGYTNHSGKRYYRHSQYKDKQGKRIDCNFDKFIPADEIENSVLIHLITTFGDVERIQQAIKRATPDMGQVEVLTREQGELTNELKKIITQKDKVVDAVADGLLSGDEITKRMEPLRDRETAINNRMSIIQSELDNIPDPSRVKRLSELGVKVLADVTRNRPQSIFKKSYEWKRRLVEHAFTGKDSQGKRLGVYIEESGAGWTFEIRGAFETTLLSLPLSDAYLIEAFHLDAEFQDVPKELEKIKSSFVKYLLSIILH